MRALIIGATALLAGCAAQAASSQAPVGPGGQPDRVEVYVHSRMSYSVEEGGEGRFRSGDTEHTFPVTREEYARMRALLEPYRENGLLCDDPEQTRWNAGYFLWRENGVESRQPYETTCYTDTYRAASRGVDQVYYAIRDMADERWVPPPALPAPDRLILTSLYWGRVTQQWSIPRGGEARWSRDDESRAFLVSEADFDRLRDLFRSYEGVRFECERVIADGPYGHVTWSQEGHEDQQLEWDAGCVTGDAGDVFRRLDEAEALLRSLRDR